MHLEQIHTLRTGVSLEISAAAVQALIADATEGRRLLELARIERLEDIHPYLTVTVRAGAPALVERRKRWAGEIRNDVLAGNPVAYESFRKLFWRDMDEDDPDGDEWHRHISGADFGSRIVAVLDKVRSAQRALRRSSDVAIRMDLEFLNTAVIPNRQQAF